MLEEIKKKGSSMKRILKQIVCELDFALLKRRKN